MMESPRVSALAIHSDGHARVQTQELKGTTVLGRSQRWWGPFDAGTTLMAHAVHLQAFAACNVEDAVRPIAHRLKSPELIWRFVHIPGPSHHSFDLMRSQ